MKVLAFYLPQFHRTEENDAWWGEGFTEWANIKKAQPLFEGHQQPKAPLDGEYYNLLDVEVMKQQIALAKKAGIYGFCVYHYWFGSKMLLEKPMESYLADQECDFPFCFSWANETWTNAWATDDNSKRKILMKQEYGDEGEWERHFQYLLPFFRDRRYIKEGNCPMLVIYRPQYIPCLSERLAYYRKRAIEEGFAGLVICAQHVSYDTDTKVDKKCIDHRIEYQPGYAMQEMEQLGRLSVLKANVRNWLKDHGISYRSVAKKQIQFYDYDVLWQKILQRKAEKGAFPGAFIDWDNSPRYGLRAKVCRGASPVKFRDFFIKLIKKTRQEYGSDYIFVFSWNEWSEGGYFEPDNWNGYGYLDALHEALVCTDEMEV